MFFDYPSLTSITRNSLDRQREFGSTTVTTIVCLSAKYKKKKNKVVAVISLFESWIDINQPHHSFRSN